MVNQKIIQRILLALKDEKKLVDKLEDGAKYGLWRRAPEMKQSVYLQNPLDWGHKFEEPVLSCSHSQYYTHMCVYIMYICIFLR